MPGGLGQVGSASPSAPPGIRRLLPRLALLPALLTLVAAPALSQEAVDETRVCVVKTEASGGKLGFVVRAADAPRFIRAGFASVACPATLDRSVTGIGARCGRFRALDAIGQKMIEDMFGVSVAQMCAAHDAWARSHLERQ